MLDRATTPKQLRHDVDLRVAARVKQARLAACLSQEKVAEALGLTFQQVQKYEKGVNRMSGGTIAFLADLLGRDIAWFFDAPPATESVDFALRVDDLFVRDDSLTPYVDEAQRFTRARASAETRQNPSMIAVRAAEFGGPEWLSRAGLVAAIEARELGIPHDAMPGVRL